MVEQPPLFPDLPRTKAQAKAEGAPFYFPGLLCLKRHLAPRSTSRSRCLTCAVKAREEAAIRNGAVRREAARERTKYRRAAAKAEALQVEKDKARAAKQAERDAIREAKKKAAAAAKRAANKAQRIEAARAAAAIDPPLPITAPIEGLCGPLPGLPESPPWD